jgi:hypothetical protein
VFVPIETFALSPLDTNPALPQSRDFTTNNATLSSAWFRVAFIDGELAEQLSAPVYFPNPGARPSAEDIATILWARTRNSAGAVGAFSTTTSPTLAQVEKMIDSSVADVAMRAGLIPEGLEGVARHAAALWTAASIERSYFPEQANNENSAYALFREDYLEAVARIVEAVIDPAPGTSGVVSVPIYGDNRYDPLTGALIV